jgi:hypothetical protein
LATRRFNQQTNVLTSDYTKALDRNTGVGITKRLSEVIAQAYTRDYYKFQSNTFFALVIAQTENRSTDVRTARNTFSELEYQRESVERQASLEKFRYPSCKVRILETGHSFLGDPTDPDGVFKFNTSDDLQNSVIPKKLRALNIAYADMHGFPAYSRFGEFPEYGDVVLVEVDNVSDPRDIKILEIVAKKIIEPLNFSGGAEINPSAPGGSSGGAGAVISQAAAAAIISPDQSGLLPEALSSDLNNYDRLRYFLGASTTRNRAVQPALLANLQLLAEQTSTWLEIFSAGQPSQELIRQYPQSYNGDEGSYRTGRRRHDFGWAVDVRIRKTEFNFGRGYENFIEVNTNIDRTITLLKNFAEKAYSLGITGIGAGNGYMNNPSSAGAIHLDMAFYNNPEDNTNLAARYWGGFPCGENPSTPPRTTKSNETFQCSNGRQSESAPQWLKDAARSPLNSGASQTQNITSQEEEQEEEIESAERSAADLPQGLIQDFQDLNLPIPGGILRTDTILVANINWNVVESPQDQSSAVNGMLAGIVSNIYRPAIEEDMPDIGTVVEIEVSNPTDGGVQKYFIAGLDSESLNVERDQLIDTSTSILNAPPRGPIYFSIQPSFNLAQVAGQYNSAFNNPE